MKIKNWGQFIKESFSLSNELYQFISKNSIKKDEFLESLEEVQDIQSATIHFSTHIVDENGHVINVDLQEGAKYKFNYTIRINYLSPKSGKIADFIKIQEDLNIISNSIQELISRVSDRAKLINNEFETIMSMVSGHQETKYYFGLIFQSDIKNLDELKKSYAQYLKTTEYTQEFNKGISQLTKYYKERGIVLSEHLETLNEKDYILVGFMTEDEICQIAVYYKQSKNFVINWREVETSIEAWMEEN